MQNQGPIRIRWQSNYNIQWRVFQADFISKLSWISRSYKVSICLYNCKGLNYRALRESKNNIRLIKSSNRIWASTVLKLLNLFGFQNGLREQRLCFWSGELRTTGSILGMTERAVSYQEEISATRVLLPCSPGLLGELSLASWHYFTCSKQAWRDCSFKLPNLWKCR